MVWNIHIIFPFSWEFHHPNWQTPSVFRWVGQPPTSLNVWKHVPVFKMVLRRAAIRCDFGISIRRGHRYSPVTGMVFWSRWSPFWPWFLPRGLFRNPLYIEWYRVVPQFGIAFSWDSHKSNFTMVYRRYIYIVNGVYKPITTFGGHHLV